jgi:hypothetical protein
MARRVSAARLVVTGLLWLSLLGGGVAAGQDPPAPVAPEVITRDAANRATVRAIRLATPLRVDGRLDEDVYRNEKPITDFIQTLPRNNSEPTERTEAWVTFDALNIYVSARCWDSAPPEKWIANEMRRDANQIRQNDHFGMMLDTFHDRRNGYVFYANPLGGRIDLTEADEGNSNADWNPVWTVRTGRFEGGWTIELAVPFKSLRYVSGAGQSWGIQMRRAIRRKNEWVHLTPLPLAMGGSQGFFRISAAATLVGLDLPEASRNIEVKPYVTSNLTSDRLANPIVDNDLIGNFGLDARYGITANLTADFTYNTDFAQVEVDEQQVNLTRFNLQFPEKRDFFLENRGIFSFGTFPTTGGSAGGSTANNASSTPVLFYSRRIGLNRNRVVPIDVGGRVSGKMGRMSVGALNIETGDEPISGSPDTNFTVLRVKRDVLRRSSIGAMFTNRSPAAAASGGNQAAGADAAFSFFNALTMGGYYARTATRGLTRDTDSYQARADFSPDRYGAQIEYLKVGDNFNPEVGFIRRDNIRRSFGSARFSPRPKNIRGVRQFTFDGSIEHIENGSGQLESRQQTGRFNTELENSDQFSIEGGANYELLLRPFLVATGVTIPSGGYGFTDATARYAFGQQRRVSGTLAVQGGQFYDGHITAVTFSSARVSITKQLSVEPTVSINRVTMPAGDFTTSVLRARTDYAFTPRMFASGLIQYSSNERAFSSNLRFRWEYRPGSEVFVVYADERDTLAPGFPGLKNRAFVVKINRMFRF